MYNVDGPNISHSEIVNIVPRERESQILVSFTLGFNWEALVFRKDYTAGINHSNEERKVEI